MTPGWDVETPGLPSSRLASLPPPLPVLSGVSAGAGGATGGTALSRWGVGQYQGPPKALATPLLATLHGPPHQALHSTQRIA